MGIEREVGAGLHKATPDNERDGWGISQCVYCHKGIKQVPGGQGSTWVHEDTGMVAG